MRVAVFGTGGVGGYFGARLAAAGHDLMFIARGRNLAALTASGLTLHSLAGDLRLPQVRATDDPQTVGEVDLVLVATKAWQVPDAAIAMQPLIGARTMVLPLVNGIEAPEQLTAALGPAPVLGGLCRIVTFLEAPGVVRHAGADPEIILGELDGSESARARAVQAALDGAVGVSAVLSPRIRVEMWQKFLFIAAASSVGGASRAPVGVVRSLEPTRRLFRTCLEEAYAVGVASGVDLDPAMIADTMAFIDGLPPTATASMQRDLVVGRPSELESQTGAVVRLGRRLGVPTPVMAALYAALLPQEQEARRADI